MATHSITLAWRIPRTEEASMLQPMGPQSVRHNSATHFHFSIKKSSDKIKFSPN